MAEPAPIDFYFDFISPYAYFASKLIGPVAARVGRRANWRPFLVGVPVIQVMGLRPLMETPLKSDYILEDLARLSRHFDIPILLDTNFASNSRAAARAFYWLADRDARAAEEFARSAFDALWRDGRDISDPDVVVALAGTVGADGRQLAEALRGERLRQRLIDEVTAAVARGVFGSPFFLVDGARYWGTDRLAHLESALKGSADSS